MTGIGVVDTPLNHAPAPTVHTTMSTMLPHDRGDYNPYGGYGYGHDFIQHHHNGWKENKKGPQAALNALTLLAFLFFLNVLQNCLRDAALAAQLPTMLILTTDPTFGRSKRDATKENLLGDTGSLSPRVWSDQQISEMVNNHVQSYWSNRETRSDFTRNADLTEIAKLIRVHNHRLKSDAPHMYTSTNQSGILNNSNEELDPKRDNATAEKQSWWQMTEMFLPKPKVKRILCSDLVICKVRKLEESLKQSKKQTTAAIGETLDWLCRPRADITLQDCRALSLPPS